MSKFETAATAIINRIGLNNLQGAMERFENLLGPAQAKALRTRSQADINDVVRIRASFTADFGVSSDEINNLVVLGNA